MAVLGQGMTGPAGGRTLCQTVWECSAPDRLTDACLRSSCFLPSYLVPERPGVLVWFLPGCLLTDLSTAFWCRGSICCPQPGLQAPPSVTSEKAVGSAPEAGFLGPLPGKPPPASSANSFPESWCLKPALWNCTPAEWFWSQAKG